jgi:hypothetical protein
VPWWAWIGLAALYVLAPLAAMRWGRAGEFQPVGRRASTAATTLLAGGSFVLLLVLTVGAQIADLQKSIYCGFDLDAIQRAMDYVKAESPTGSVVFTDDWDVFPVYFYYNHHNHYSVGLDPKFTHEVDPELWERYKRLSRGQFPSAPSVEYVDDDGNEVRHRIRVDIEDIVDYFGCDWVITDRDHQALARKLEAAPSHAKLVYPTEGSIDDVGNPPYKVFRMFSPKDRDEARKPDRIERRGLPGSDE